MQTITELLNELEAAVQAGDHARALQLERMILQRLATEASEQANLERRVRALMSEFDQTDGDDHKPYLQPEAFETEKPVLREGTKKDWRDIKPANADDDESPKGEDPDNEKLVLREGVKKDWRGVNQTFGSVDGVVYPVWFGTNRKPAMRGNGFTNERYNHITRGRVEVHVPEAHRFGETGAGLRKRLLRFDLRNDRLRVQRVAIQEREAFFTEIHEAMKAARDSGDQPHALFFLHGYRVTFEEAAIRAAQIGYDLNVAGATAFFSWPSRGSVTAYPADEASIEASERAITDFLVDFTANCGAGKVHVIAHSMGNRGLLRALQRIAANAEMSSKIKFGQIFLAAPDIDRDLFLDLSYLYPEYAERTTLYASDGDLPVHLSSKLHDAPRAGYFLPYTVAPGVDTVVAPDFDIDLLGHSYFAQAEALLHDIHDLIRHNEAPSKRQRITAAHHGGEAFWKLKK